MRNKEMGEEGRGEERGERSGVSGERAATNEKEKADTQL